MIIIFYNTLLISLSKKRDILKATEKLFKRTETLIADDYLKEIV